MRLPLRTILDFTASCGLDATLRSLSLAETGTGRAATHIGVAP